MFAGECCLKWHVIYYCIECRKSTSKISMLLKNSDELSINILMILISCFVNQFKKISITFYNIHNFSVECIFFLSWQISLKFRKITGKMLITQECTLQLYLRAYFNIRNTCYDGMRCAKSSVRMNVMVICQCESAPYNGMFLQSPKWGMHVMAICPCTINCEERTLWYGVSSCTLRCEKCTLR